MNTDFQLFQHHMLKRLFFHWIAFVPLLIINWPYMWGLLSRLSIFATDLSILMPIPCYLNCSTLQSVSKSGNASSTLSFYKAGWTTIGFLLFHVSILLGSACQLLRKRQLRFWLGLCRIYRTIWGELTLRILNLPIQKHSRSLIYLFNFLFNFFNFFSEMFVVFLL